MKTILIFSPYCRFDSKERVKRSNVVLLGSLVGKMRDFLPSDYSTDWMWLLLISGKETFIERRTSAHRSMKNE